MKNTDIEMDKDFIMDLMTRTESGDLNYIFRGDITNNLSQQLLTLAEKNIDKEKISVKVKKRVFHIMVESIQNITRHKDQEQNKDRDYSIFSVQKKGFVFYVTTGNVVENSKIDALVSKLDRVNNLDQDELNAFYKEILSNGQLSEKGGAGLGLIEMARKSGNKLTYKVNKINDEVSYFYMHSHINAQNLGEIPPENPQSIYSLEYMTNFHQFISKSNMVLIYNTVFDQESLLSLISIMNNHAEQPSFKKRLISLMVEMLQNIIHHGDIDFGGVNGSQGIFYISIDDDGNYHLNTINYIANDKISILKGKIDSLNEMSDEQREDFYNEKLFDFKICTSKEAGLGLIEMRIKSRNPLYYSFDKVNDNFSLFKFRITLDA